MKTEKALRILVLDTKQEKMYKEVREPYSTDIEDDSYLETKYITTMTINLMKDLEKAKSNRERNIFMA